MQAKEKFQVTYLCSQPLKPSGSGRDFCNACRKQIPDLRDSTKEEILHLLRRDGGKTCGIFYKDQFEVNQETHRGPGLFRLVAASLLAALVSGAKLHGQVNAADSVKTVQLQVLQGDPAHPTEIPAVKTDSAAADSIPATTETTTVPKRYKHHLFNIGRREVYYSRRFPYIHVRRHIKGMFAY